MGLDKTLNELVKAYFYVHRFVTRGIVTFSLVCKNILSALEFCNSTIYCKNTTQLVRLDTPIGKTQLNLFSVNLL